MSGIAGAVLVDGRAVSRNFLERIVTATPRRGCDGTSTWRSGPAGMIRFKRATTPEAVAETQPFRSVQSQTTICFDGRLDNRGDLLALLGGRALPTNAPDCEIALALFERLGDAFVDALIGDYALAIWQSNEQRILCARSPLGWRPFLWAFDGKTFAFATEPRSLLVGVDLERRLNEGAIGEYLAARLVSRTETFWQGVNRLPQGSALVLENGHVRTWHWHRGPFEDLADLSDAGHVERFRDLFDQALIATMRSATPVASQLSGGLDSSSVVCRATALHRAGRIDRAVRPITARFPGEPQDETEWSSAVEAHLGIDATVVVPEPYDLDASRKWCADTLHLPLRPNVIDTMSGICNRLHLDGVRVLLTGEGGDDWMNGSHAHWPDLFLRGLWGQLVREGLAQGPNASLAGCLRSLLVDTAGPILVKHQRERLFRPQLDFHYGAPSWIRREWAARIGLTERWRCDALPVRLPGFAQQHRYSVYSLARRHVNWDNVLSFADSRGIEIRHPLHDLRLTRFLMGAAGRMLRRNGQRKYLLRQAMCGTLPEKIRTRQTKANFVGNAVDAISARFLERGPHQLLCVRLGWVDGGILEKFHTVFRDWRAAGSPDPIPVTPFGPIWSALAMDMWLEHAFKL